MGAYITDLTCVLHLLFQETTGSAHPKDLSPDLISDVIRRYKESGPLTRVHTVIQNMGVLQGFEEKIAELIREETGTLSVASLTDPPSPGKKRRPVWKNWFGKDS